MGTGNWRAHIILADQTKLNSVPTNYDEAPGEADVWRWSGRPLSLNAFGSNEAEAIQNLQLVGSRSGSISAAPAFVKTPFGRTQVAGDEVPAYRRSLTLTDGEKAYSCGIDFLSQEHSETHEPQRAGAFLVFTDFLPPPDRDLKVIEAGGFDEPLGRLPNARRSCTGFCQGTMIRTPTGETPIEEISAGDQVVSEGGEARTVIWAGETHLTGARLRVYPELRPIVLEKHPIWKSATIEPLWWRLARELLFELETCGTFLTLTACWSARLTC